MGRGRVCGAERLLGCRRGPLLQRTVNDADVNFDERGLVPCIVQAWDSGEVLTLAYMNAEGARQDP